MEAATTRASISRSIRAKVDNDGPTVTDATLVTTSGETADLNVNTSATTQNSISYIVVNVSEALYDNLTKTGNAASNPANYVLLDSTGKAIPGAIYAVITIHEFRRFRHRRPAASIEIVLTLDADRTTASGARRCRTAPTC